MYKQAVLSCLICASSACTVISSDFETKRENYVLEPHGGVYFLPRTVIKVQSYFDDKGKPMLSVAKVVETDPKTRLIYRIHNSPLSDDTIDVKTDSSGLLTSISSDTTDQTGNIAVKLAELVFTTSTGVPLPQGVGRALPDGAFNPENSFQASYDPFDPAEVASVRAGMPNFCIAVGNQALLPPEQACSSLPAQTYLKAPPYFEPGSPISGSVGVYYRRPVPQPVRIYKVIAQKNAKKSYQTLYVGSEQFFDKSTLYEIAIDRTAFVQKKITLAFTSGSLTTVNIVKQSEVLAAVNVPVKIAQIVLAIPLEGLKHDKALVDAQADLLKSQAALINNQKTLVNLQTEQTSTSGRGLVLSPDYGAIGRALDFGAPIIDPARLADCVATTGLTVDECRARLSRGL
jgi:hypothetical protein